MTRHPVDRAMETFRKEQFFLRLFDITIIIMILMASVWLMSKFWLYFDVIQVKAAAYDEIQAYLSEQTAVTE